MIKIAFYKGTKDGIAGVYNRGARWIEDGIYSHCEIIFSNGLSASSSFMGGGGIADGVNKKANDQYRAIIAQEKTQNEISWGFGNTEIEYETL